MLFLRRQLPRFAALVMLLWLFATGVAFAHACQSKIDLDCDTCCPEMKAAVAWSETRAVPLAAVQPTLPPPLVTTVTPPAWHPAQAQVLPWASPPDPGGGPGIPILLLRLAL